MSTIDRRKAAIIARETIQALEAGHYTNAAGEVVDISDPLHRAVEGTITYPPGAALSRHPAGSASTTFAVTNETTLAAARRLVGEGFRTAALNFASARHPGGGFLNGARAQEESLCRSSGLYFCIRGNPMYAHHAGQTGGFYSNYALHSPNVPVFREDDGTWLARPYLCSFVTAPAVNAGAVRPDQRGAIRAEMAQRVVKVLTIMAGQGHDAVVLGAWGCGVFKNDPEVLAELFREVLSVRFHGVFSRVVFAVLDGSEDRQIIGPFQERFPS
jgi:uncharacterized protein (TIGR02452 family)